MALRRSGVRLPSAPPSPPWHERQTQGGPAVQAPERVRLDAGSQPVRGGPAADPARTASLHTRRGTGGHIKMSQDVATAATEVSTGTSAPWVWTAPTARFAPPMAISSQSSRWPLARLNEGLPQCRSASRPKFFAEWGKQASDRPDSHNNRRSCGGFRPLNCDQPADISNGGSSPSSTSTAHRANSCSRIPARWNVST